MRRITMALSSLLIAGSLFAGPPRNVTYTYGTGSDTGRVTPPSGVTLDWTQNINGVPASTYTTDTDMASYATLDAVETYADSALSDAMDYADGLFTTANEYSEQLNASEADSRIAGDAATLANANGYTDSAIAAIPDFGVADTSWTGDNWTVTNEAPSQRAAQEAILTRASQTSLNSLDSELAEHVADIANPHSVTATQVGSDTAQWNADKLQGRDISDAAPTDKQGLTWNATETQWEPGAAGHVIQDNGTPSTARSNLNFIGFTLSDDEVGDATKVELPEGQEEINFTSSDGAGVSWSGDVVTFTHALGVADVLGEFFNSAGGGGYRLTLADSPTTTAATFDMTPLGGNAAVTGTWKVRLVANSVGSGGGGSGASAFTDLTDAPSSYSGYGGKLVAVNAGATALEFVDSPTAGMDNPMTAAGDIIVGGADGAATRLAAGAEGQVVTIVSGVPAYAAPSGGVDAVGFQDTAIDAYNDSLVAEWQFDRPQLTSDSLGDNPLTRNVLIVPGSGKNKYCAVMPGGTYLARTGVDASVGAYRVMFSGWFYTASAPAENTALIFESTTTAGYTRFAVSVDNAQHIVVSGRTSSTGTIISTTGTGTWSLSAWHHVLVLVDTANNIVRISLDGTVESLTFACSGAALCAGAAENPLWIGYNNGAYFTGSLDEFTLWRSPVVTSDNFTALAAALYNSGNGKFYNR